jgi:UDP-glucose 4-epimerase
VLVTGGAGFIGSHLAEALVARGDAVTVVDDLRTGTRENVAGGADLVRADVADADAVDAVAAAGFDAVLHVAAQASVVRSFADPRADLAANVLGTLNVLRACERHGIPRLLYASSMTVYGNPDELPAHELSPCRPTSYYGVTKYAAERYVHIAGSLAGARLGATSLRMFNVYGERQSLANPYQGVLAIFVGNLLRGEPITVHGDGMQTRDFVYVGDVVDAWLRVLDADETAGMVLNLGSGRETSIDELARTVVSAAGFEPASWPVRTGDAQRGDIRRSVADVGLARRALGWRPVTTLDEGLARTLAWAAAGDGARAAR